MRELYHPFYTVLFVSFFVPDVYVPPYSKCCNKRYTPSNKVLNDIICYMEKGYASNLEKENINELKYLIYFQPGKNLENLILEQDDLILPNSGLHTTLCIFNMDEEKEEELIEDISKINFNSFEIETLDFDNFDENSLVLKLSCPNELLKLHLQVISLVEGCASQDFSEIKNKYFGENYNPHLTISKSFSNFDKSSNDLIGKKDIVKNFSVAKKVDGVYYKIQEFEAID